MSLITSTPLPQQPGLQFDLRGGRVGAKLDDPPASAPYRPHSRTGLTSSKRVGSIVPEDVPPGIDALKRNNREAVAEREGGVDHWQIIARTAT